MFSSKDFEKLWFLYQTEGVPEEESINSFCEKNGVPYAEFDKWFRRGGLQRWENCHKQRYVDMV